MPTMCPDHCTPLPSECIRRSPSDSQGQPPIRLATIPEEPCGFQPLCMTSDMNRDGFKPLERYLRDCSPERPRSPERLPSPVPVSAPAPTVSIIINCSPSFSTSTTHATSRSGITIKIGTGTDTDADAETETEVSCGSDKGAVREGGGSKAVRVAHGGLGMLLMTVLAVVSMLVVGTAVWIVLKM